MQRPPSPARLCSLYQLSSIWSWRRMIIVNLNALTTQICSLHLRNFVLIRSRENRNVTKTDQSGPQVTSTHGKSQTLRKLSDNSSGMVIPFISPIIAMMKPNDQLCSILSPEKLASHGSIRPSSSPQVCHVFPHSTSDEDDHSCKVERQM